MEVEPTSIDNIQDTANGPSAQFIAIAARLIQTTGVAAFAGRQLTPGASPKALLNAITVSTDPSTGFITITAQSETPQRAADIANAFGQAVNSARAKQAVTQLDQTLSNLEGQLNALPRKARTARKQLSGQIQRLRAQRAAQNTNTQVIEPATPPSGAV